MDDDRGQVMPWLLLVVLLAMVLIVFAARLSSVVDDAAQARTAADAAALAGAVEGEASARTYAALNGGRLVSFVRTGRGVEVVVRVGEVSARAEAATSSSWQRSTPPD